MSKLSPLQSTNATTTPVWAARLGTNPIYRGRWRGRMLELQLRWPNPVFHRECGEVERLLPTMLDVTREDLDRVLRGDVTSDDPVVHGLLSRFVLVPLAPGYCRHDLVAAASTA